MPNLYLVSNSLQHDPSTIVDRNDLSAFLEEHKTYHCYFDQLDVYPHYAFLTCKDKNGPLRTLSLRKNDTIMYNSRKKKLFIENYAGKYIIYNVDRDVVRKLEQCTDKTLL